MTTFERFERDIPRLMDELAPPRLPDYLDDMLSRTARTSQRPAWASLERWLPMASTTRALSLRPVSVGGIVLIALLVLALIATALVVGTRLQTSHPLTSLVMAQGYGGIVAIDPETGETASIASGIANFAPVVAPDGRRFAFMRDGSVLVADTDGSNQRTLTTLTGGFDRLVVWSPDGTMLQATHEGSVVVGPGQDHIAVLSIIDVERGTTTDLDLGIDVGEGTMWRPGSTQLIVPGKTLADDGTDLFGLWLVEADGSGLRPIVDPVPNESAWMRPTASPDGRLIAATLWDPNVEYPGRIRMIDIDDGTVTTLDVAGTEIKSEFAKRFSPDGSTLLLERYYLDDDGQDAFRLGLVPVSGGEAMLIGPNMGRGKNGADVAFSPDGTQIVARYGEDRSVWLLDAVDGGEGTKVDWQINGPISWGQVH